MARPDTWPQEEKQWLIDNYAAADWDAILTKLNKKKTTIIGKAASLGIQRENVALALYTPEEDEAIREYWPCMPGKEFVNKYMPYRTIRSVELHASRLGIYRRLPWTSDEDMYIKEHYYDMTVDELSAFLTNHTREAVYKRIGVLGLTGAPTYKYTKEDIQFMQDNYLTMSDTEIGVCLHRAAQSIKEFRRKLQLYRKDPGSPTHYTDLGFFIKCNNLEWKREAMERYNYKCALTDEAFDDIHHLYAKNLIIQATLDKLELPDTFDINACSTEEQQTFLNAFLAEQAKYPGGVCLSHKMHMLFHNKYGYGDNTPEQFYEFVKQVAPNKLDKILA